MSSTPTGASELYLRAMESVEDEVDVELSLTFGALPEELRGTLYRNGPGRVERFGTRYGHPFDGDGMVLRFSFDGTRVRYRNRYVRTAEWNAETAAGRLLYRGFGTNLPGGILANALRLRFKNAANTSVVVHDGELYALWEGGAPHRLDPTTLHTLARERFGGALANRSLSRFLSPDLPFSAHPKLDPRDGRVLYNFGVVAERGRTSKIFVHRLVGGRLERDAEIELGALAFIHDFILTERHQVFFIPDAAFDLLPVLLGMKTPVGSIRGGSRGTSRALVRRRRDGRVTLLEVPAGFVFHFGNGYDEGEDRVVVDACAWRRFPVLGHVDARSAPAFPTERPFFTRFHLELARGHVAAEALAPYPAELPTHHPGKTGLPHRFLWATAQEPNASWPFHTGLLVLRVDTKETRFVDFAPDLPGEPLFVPARSASAGEEQEGEGWILTLVYRTELHTSELCVLRARDLTTVARLRLPHHVPPGFHGTWVGSPVKSSSR